MKIKICSDSTCDLSEELLEKYDISILPLYVMKEDEEHRDGVDITPDDIYAFTNETGKLCTTAAISVQDYIDFFTAELADCDELVHFHISSDMSSCYQNACIAANEVDKKVYPIDARNLSTGIGQLVLAAAEMAQSGASGAEISEAMTAKREKLDVSFVVDTLVYLHKGGRCSAVAALGANLLSLKPCIEVKNGAMGVGKKYRGSMEKCLIQYVRDRLASRNDVDTKRIFITHSGVTPELIEKVREEVLKHQKFEEVLITRAGSTISSHCGPGTLGILFLTK